MIIPIITQIPKESLESISFLARAIIKEEHTLDMFFVPTSYIRVTRKDRQNEKAKYGKPFVLQYLIMVLQL